MEFEKNASWWRNSTFGSNFDTLGPAGTFICVIMQNFSQIELSVAELHQFYHFTIWGSFWGRFPLPSVRDQDPRLTQCSMGPKSVHPKRILMCSAIFAQCS